LSCQHPAVEKTRGQPAQGPDWNWSWTPTA